MTAYLERFGSTALPTALPDSDAGTDGSALVFTPLPWGGLFDGLGSGVAGMPGNKLKYRCRMIGADANALDNQYRLYYRPMRGTRADLRRRNGDGSQHWCWARCTEIKGNWTYKNLTYLDLDFDFQMLSPCWYGETPRSYTTLIAVTDPDDLTTTLAESGSSVLYVDHSGNIDQPAAVFTAFAVGVVTSVIINNVTTGYSFTYSGTVASGNALVIDTGAMSVKNNGADDYANFTPPVDHEEWMHIAPGPNKFVITITGGGRLDLDYWEAFA